MIKRSIRAFKRGMLWVALSGVASAGHYEDITTEALRPNVSSEGRPLPLASHWQVHNWRGSDALVKPGEKKGTSYPFHMDKLMDDVDAGHYVLPFITVPGGTGAKELSDYTGFERLAAAGLPITITYANILDSMFNKEADADRFWHKEPAQNPAFIRHDLQGEVGVNTSTGVTSVDVKGFPANTTLKSGSFVLFFNHRRVYKLAATITTDAYGDGTLQLATALTGSLGGGETVAQIEKQMDFYSGAPLSKFAQAGTESVTKNMELWNGLAEIYPNPPAVYHVDNNENSKVNRLEDCGISWHYRERFGAPIGPQNEWWKYPVASLHWAEQYTNKVIAFMDAKKSAVPWDDSLEKDIAYNGYGWSWEMGRWGGWKSHAIPYNGYDTYMWGARDGSSPEFYVYDWNYATDDHIGSPHVGAMQAFAMTQERLFEQRPDYHWEVSAWDGGVKMRKSYAKYGRLEHQTLAKLVSAISTDGEVTEVDIKNATPNSTIALQGDMVAFADNKAAFPHQIYSLRDDVMSDGSGKAKLYLDRAIVVNGDHPAMAAGSAVHIYPYMDRFEGLCRYALWMCRPRILRDWEWGTYDSIVLQKWDRVMAVVDEVWSDPVYRRFWRKGDLVVNPDFEETKGVKHPLWSMTDIDKYGRNGPLDEMWVDDEGQPLKRFYQLTCPLNPDFADWKERYQVQTVDDSTLIKVWAFAYTLGSGDDQEWLLFTQAPGGDLKSVEIEIPGYGTVFVDAPQKGKLHHFTAQPAFAGLNFTERPVHSYGGGQDAMPSNYSVQDDGETLALWGNTWKRVAKGTTITPNTVMVFDFKSTIQAEVSGIGFDTDYSGSPDRFFQVHGSQNWGTSGWSGDYTGAGEWQTFVVPVGEYLSGDFTQIFFANDHDGRAKNGNGWYRNLRIFEQASYGVGVEAEHFDSTTGYEVYGDDPDMNNAALGGQVISYVGAHPQATYTVTFPEPGEYHLYMRGMVPDYDPNSAAERAVYSELGQPNEKQSRSGANDSCWVASSFGGDPSFAFCSIEKDPLNYRWTNVSLYNSAVPVYTVPSGQLTQTFVLKGREDGFVIDAIAFVKDDVAPTEAELDELIP